MRFVVLHFGCKVNWYEGRGIASAWEELGHEEVSGPGEAEVVVVNACAVTARAVADARAAVRRAARENPDARVVVTGCAAQVAGEEFRAMPEVVRVVGQKDKRALLLGPEAEPPAPEIDFAPRTCDRARAVVLAQDGCSNFCSYCVVPLARGGPKSRSPQAVAAEVERFFAQGFGEVVLSLVNTAQYGLDLPGRPDFWDLVQGVDAALAPAWHGRARIRLSSIWPGLLGEKGLETLARTRLVVEHLHLSLQSGDPGVLAAMNRADAYSAESVLAFTAGLARIWPVFGLGADLLVGFPGESESAFANTRDLAAELPLTYAHVFPFSRRPGTKAATMPGHLPKETKKIRAAELRRMAAAKKQAFLETLRALPSLEMAATSTDPAMGKGRHYESIRLPNPLPPTALRQLITRTDAIVS